MSHSVKMHIWDSTGDVKFRPLSNQQYRKAAGIVLVYDVTDEASFQHTVNWFNKIRQQKEITGEVIILGNKCDLINEMVVS
jgi:GTPase SAR1 family protein